MNCSADGIFEVDNDVLPEKSGRFHCQFNTGINEGPEDTVILESIGKGQFVGMSLSMQGKAKANFSFLEAPEYFFVDGEEAAAVVGTGLEDYFNGGWYFRDGEFTGELHGVPIKEALYSMITMYRFHEHDAVFYNDSLKIVFRNPIPSGDTRPFWYSSSAYYYLDGIDKFVKTLPSADDMMKMYMVRNSDHLSMP